MQIVISVRGGGRRVHEHRDKHLSRSISAYRPLPGGYARMTVTFWVPSIACAGKANKARSNFPLPRHSGLRSGIFQALVSSIKRVRPSAATFSLENMERVVIKIAIFKQTYSGHDGDKIQFE